MYDDPYPYADLLKVIQFPNTNAGAARAVMINRFNKNPHGMIEFAGFWWTRHEGRARTHTVQSSPHVAITCAPTGEHIDEKPDSSFLLANCEGRIVAELRPLDGFVNATRMCTTGKRFWADYYRLDSTKQYLELLCRDKQCDEAFLIDAVKGGLNQGTWVHHEIALHLAYWISPACQFAVTRLVSRYLTGHVTTQESQSAAHRLKTTSSLVQPVLELKSCMDNLIDLRKMQIYVRRIYGVFKDLHPIGHPELAIPPAEQDQLAIAKLGFQGDNTGRQMVHSSTFKNSKIIDSCFTSTSGSEQKLKDVLLNEGKLYEGLHCDKNAKDTELVVFKTQPEYENFIKLTCKVIAETECTQELALACEKTKQADAEARKAEADAEARKAEAEADARKAEAEAECREAEASAEARKAEASARIRLAELKLERQRLKSQITNP